MSNENQTDDELQARMDKVMALLNSVVDATNGDNPLEDLQKSLEQIDAVRRELGLPEDEGPTNRRLAR